MSEYPVEDVIAARMANWLTNKRATNPEWMDLDEFVEQTKRVVRGVLFESMMQAQYVTFPENDGLPDRLLVQLQEV